MAHSYRYFAIEINKKFGAWGTRPLFMCRKATESLTKIIYKEIDNAGSNKIESIVVTTIYKDKHGKNVK